MPINESDSAAFRLGKGARIGKIEVRGTVAGRDVIVGPTAAEAVSAEDLQQILALLKRVQEQTATLAKAPAGLREDAQDELRKAHEAGERGDNQRLVDKLGAAQKYLEQIGQSLPPALGLATTVAALIQRVTGLG